MKILMFGNPSMFQSNLAAGLRQLGHQVTLVSHRSGWRKFTGHDIQLERRRDLPGKLSFLLYTLRIITLLPKWRGYDIVQLAHCGFLELRGNHMLPIYHLLRRWNKHIVLCCSDVDYHVLDRIEHHSALRYSEFQIGTEPCHNDNVEPLRQQYQNGDPTRGEKRGVNADLSISISRDSDAIVPVLYEYWCCYKAVYPDKTTYIPLPVNTDEAPAPTYTIGQKVRIMIGLQRDRMQIKGSDIMLRAAQDITRDHPEDCELTIVENVPYEDYIHIMEHHDVLIDQLYSYTPAMNALTAMSKGLVVVGGGEPENYQILGEQELRPIINVLPTYESCYQQLADLVTHKERIPELKRQSVEYIARHHNYLKVAQQYEELYRKIAK